MANSPLSRDFLRTLNPEVFERAAEYVFAYHSGTPSVSTRYSCVAIQFAVASVTRKRKGEYAVPYLRSFTQAFRGEGPVLKHPFWNLYPTEERQAYRANSLLTMAAMVRDARAEGRKL